MVAVLLESSELHVAIHESEVFRSTWTLREQLASRASLPPGLFRSRSRSRI